MLSELMDIFGQRNRWIVATVVGYVALLAAIKSADAVLQLSGQANANVLGPIAIVAGGPAIGLCLMMVARGADRWRAGVTGSALYLIGLVAVAGPMIGVLAAERAAGVSWPRVMLAAPMEMQISLLSAAIVAGIASLLMADGGEGFKRARSAALGDARWLDMTEASKLFPPDGEVVIGEAYRPDHERRGHEAFEPGNKRTWGSGGKGQLLTYKLDFDSTHMLFFAGSGGYKTTSTVEPTALRYSGSMVVLDPAGEVGVLVGAVRQGMGRMVHKMDPAADGVSGCDVLEPIVGSTTLLTDAVAFARLMTAESPKKTGGSEQYFEQQTLNLMTGLLVYVLVSKDCERDRKLSKLREFASLTEADLKQKIGAIVGSCGKADDATVTDNADYRLFLKETLGPYVKMADQTFTGVASSVAKDTQWLSIPALRAMVCGSDFKVSQLPDGHLDVFIQMPGDLMKSYPGVCRTLIGSFMKAMEAARGTYAKRVLFVLDEVDLLGYMSLLEEARDRGRKYGITLMMMYQSVGQLEKHFGKEGATSWFEGCAFASYAAIKSRETAEQLSKQVGDVTVEVEGRSQSVSWMDGLMSRHANQNARLTQSVSLQKRPLILPHEIREMRADEQIIMVRGYPAVRAGRAIYFRRPEMLAGLGQSAFAPTGKQVGAKGVVAPSSVLGLDDGDEEPDEAGSRRWVGSNSVS